MMALIYWWLHEVAVIVSYNGYYSCSWMGQQKPPYALQVTESPPCGKPKKEWGDPHANGKHETQTGFRKLNVTEASGTTSNINIINHHQK